MIIAWLILPLSLLGIVLALWVPSLRLKRALARPFPAEWSRILERNLPVYPRLPAELRERLHRLIQQFLHQKHFTGVAGLEMNDEIRVTIAAEACLLILNRPSGVYPALRYIIVYPGAFVVDYEDVDEAGVVDPEPRELLGESWQNGKVVLAWDSVMRGARNFVDGQNVVLHEFAHQLDHESGYADGAPLLGGEHSYRSWAEVLGEAYEVLQESSRDGRESLLDEYGASHPAEFFAVATETFFERPGQMARHHRRLFETLKAYYRVDPREWLDH
ncbi:zinc-dependent peptidase [Elongatibacter sediminis]|uniref:M90 family metallopeptidase n=1 Tax=Elongatibacter sediminis TaxID=3119006 RepID=A0AAW9R4J3_9GAMM